MITTVSLQRNRDFQRVYRNGKYKAARYLVIYAYKNRLSYNRLGIAAGKKFGNSVQRNRVKRLIRENYRLLESKYAVGYDIVIMARASVRQASAPNNRLKAVYVPSFEEIKKELVKLSAGLGLFL